MYTFWLKGAYYRQIKGLVMGYKFAPLYFYLFMGVWEDIHINHINHRVGSDLVTWKK